MVTETFCAEETFELGRSLGEQAKPGDIYTLNGDLGVGKTVFSQGLAKGLGIAEPISSPTFTIVQVYEEGRLPFYHFDVYRIGDAEEMEEIGYQDYFYGNGVCLIEWADLIREILPEKFYITLSLTNTTTFSATSKTRHVHFCTWFCKWEMVRSKTYFNIFTE